MKKELRDVVVVGAALFAMFFGAGNLIFPPALGFLAGDNWFLCMLGFLLTGVGLPILGVVAIARSKGSFDLFAGRVHPAFAKILGTGIVLSIGPFLAIPRTAATVYEIGIQPMFSDVSPVLVSALYFSITLLFVLKPSSIIDKIGKFLTPALLLIITIIIFIGVSQPMGVPLDTAFAHPFSNGFSEGYQTMDAMASILFAGLILTALKAKGYTEPKQQMKLACQSGLIAGAGLMFVYGGLLYLGATGNNVFPAGISRADLIVSMTNTILGRTGQIAMCLVVSVACLTTAVGLTAVVGDYFSELSGGKLAYKPVVLATTIFSACISVSGIENIVKLSVPLLIIAYPVIIVLILLTLIGKNLNAGVFRGAVAGAVFVSLFDVLSYLKIETGTAGSFIAKLPFASSGFGWILPATLGAVLFGTLMQKMAKPVNTLSNHHHGA
ncbi:branched-chain amino acid transport system II carrier protein [Desulfotalea psychrophila]|uniref:Probable branched-chain amino acid transport protein n=1 Tax=Desulfotalea psychrophila (strain LSv54 / DSM 12343) TaxID=177439 RepID=Q6ANE8_DESPS|nr:branched-chain amino acid transport system II carrier protein [Desulfotalea psychrophila]CAG36126.1 probable branched-chain amino acid transport protein [Desulfotalea psychrophila LSv54]